MPNGQMNEEFYESIYEVMCWLTQPRARWSRETVEDLYGLDFPKHIVLSHGS